VKLLNPFLLLTPLYHPALYSFHLLTAHLTPLKLPQVPSSEHTFFPSRATISLFEATTPILPHLSTNGTCTDGYMHLNRTLAVMLKNRILNYAHEMSTSPLDETSDTATQ
jgi:hypothetical protein